MQPCGHTFSLLDNSLQCLLLGCISSGVLEVTLRIKMKRALVSDRADCEISDTVYCTTHGVKEPHPTTHGVREDAI